MKKLELSTTGTAMRFGLVAPTLGSRGEVCPQPARRRFRGGMTDAIDGTTTPGLPPSAPPIT
jgi:hypothetical protein